MTQSHTVELVPGITCKRGHFNDPDTAYCSLCGTGMVHRTRVVVTGYRPPLGVLVFDDGRELVVDADFLLGRAPTERPRMRALAIADPELLLSREHAEIRLRGWRVTLADVASANGTFVYEPVTSQWRRLDPHVVTTLRTGALVQLGSRRFSFQSHHAARSA